MRGKWLLFGASVILAAIATGAFLSLRNQQAQPKAAPAPAAAPIPAGITEITLDGKIESQQVLNLGAPVDGMLEDVFHEPGHEIYEGQLIARIRNEGLESDRDRAKEEVDRLQTRVNNLESSLLAARLEASRSRAEASRMRDVMSRAEREFERQKMLNKQGATPRLTYEKADKDFESASITVTGANSKADIAEGRVAQLNKDIEAAKKTVGDKSSELEDAEAELKSADVTSPVDGILLSIKVGKGAEVKREMEDLFRIAVDLNRLQVILEPTPAQLALIKPGQPAQVFLVEAGSESLPGEVSVIKDNKVTVVFLSPAAAIVPGLTARVRIKLA